MKGSSTCWNSSIHWRLLLILQKLWPSLDACFMRHFIRSSNLLILFSARETMRSVSHKDLTWVSQIAYAVLTRDVKLCPINLFLAWLQPGQWDWDNQLFLHLSTFLLTKQEQDSCKEIPTNETKRAKSDWHIRWLQRRHDVIHHRYDVIHLHSDIIHHWMIGNVSLLLE